MINNQESRKKHKGFTLIELLISMTLGVFVTMGIYQLFFSTKQSLTFLNAQSRMQEDARYAFSFIASKLQQAGELGCQVVTEDTVDVLVNTASDNTFRPWRIIEGWEADETGYDDAYSTKLNDTVIYAHSNAHWTTSGNAELNSGIKSKRKSDILRIWYALPKKTKLTTVNSGILTFPGMDLKRGDILVINDCSRIKLVQVCACDTADTTACSSNDSRADLVNCSSTSPANQSSDLGDINIGTAEIRILEESVFFVGKRGDNRYNLPSLYWKNLGNNATLGNKEEILEGVESLQILYGQDTDGDKVANYYMPANSISDWGNVISLRISLLMISRGKNLVLGNPNVILNNHPITIEDNDHHLRKVFTTTIALRNRIVGL